MSAKIFLISGSFCSISFNIYLRLCFEFYKNTLQELSLILVEMDNGKLLKEICVSCNGHSWVWGTSIYCLPGASFGRGTPIFHLKRYFRIRETRYCAGWCHPGFEPSPINELHLYQFDESVPTGLRHHGCCRCLGVIKHHPMTQFN